MPSLLDQPVPYESHIVCEFFRQIGGLEVMQDYELNISSKARGLLAKVLSDDLNSRQKALKDLQVLFDGAEESLGGYSPTMVGNAQNPLDHLVGDVIGKTNSSRYFIIEFKRYACGFVNEVHPDKGKPDRAALFGHLNSDSLCRELSMQGHLGAYVNQGEILFGKYFNLSKGVEKELIQLPAFFNKAQDIEFAWSSDDLLAYITCMTDHGVEMSDDDGQIVFGYFDQEAQFVAMVGPASIFARIHNAFTIAHAMYQQSKGLKPRGG